MLHVCAKKFRSLTDAATDDFEHRMAAHLRRCFHERLRQLDQDAILRLVRDGSERASGYGISSERGVCSFIDIICILGTDFDACEKFRWTVSFLRNESIPDPNVRAIALLDAVQALSDADVEASEDDAEAAEAQEGSAVEQ